MTDKRKRLFDMVIDEISVVDTGANQHSAIVFSKALGPEEDSMPDLDLYDMYGNPVDDLEIGDVVYDDEGNEYQYVAVDEDDEEFEPEMEYADYGKSADYDSVEKMSLRRGYGLFHEGARAAGMGQRVQRGAPLSEGFGPVGAKGRAALKAGELAGRGAQGASAAGRRAKGFYTAPGESWGEFGSKKNKVRWGRVAATGGVVGGAAGAGAYGYERTKKSLGDVVLDELSKAASEDERSEIIAKAMQEVEIAKAQANEAWERVAQQEDAMLEQAFISKAAEFNLPVDNVELGRILKAASTVLDDKQLNLLEDLFTGMGEILYEEHGYVGDTDNASVMDVVNGYVNDNVAKGDFTPEELSVAVFEANPQAYDQYIAEQNRW